MRPSLTKKELRTGLGFLLGAVLLLPLAPDRPLGPYGAINPQSLVRLVFVLAAISFAGRLAERLLGPRFGLSLTGLAGGLVSSTATIAAMGQRAREGETSWPRAASGALASNIATVVLYPVMMAAVDPSLLPSLAAPLLWAGAMATLSASALFGFGMRNGDDATSTAPPFQLRTALGVLGLVTAVSISSAVLQAHLGNSSIVVISAVAALLDAHSAAGSVANLHHSGTIDAATARLSVVMALTANSLTKIVMAWSSRHRLYALCVSAGIVAMVCGAWLGIFLS